MKFRILFSLSILLLASACNTDEFLDEGPLDEYTSASVYRTQEDMIIAVNGLYDYLPFLDQRFGESRLWLWTDDGWRRNGGREGSDLSWSSDEVFLDFYFYDQIRQCNEVIARIPDASFNSDAIATRLNAEARFIRAMLYERMVFLYGDVPLVTEPQGVDFFPSRSPRIDVFNFVIQDLADVADILPESYNGNDEGRATKWAALALQARAYLNAVGWHPSPASVYDGAEAVCQTIIQQGGFSLDDGIDGFRRLFMPESDFSGSNPSKATILARVYIQDLLWESEIAYKCLPRSSYEGSGDGAGNNQAQYGATWNIVSAFQTINGLAPADDPDYDPANPFENRDPRFRASFILPGDSLQIRGGGGTEYYFFEPHPDVNTERNDRADRNTGIDTGYLIRKYSGLSLDDNATQTYVSARRAHADFKIIRYAEILLMMAECLAADNNPQALDFINQVRSRAGMPPYNSVADVPRSVMSGTTGNDLIDAVLLERRYEFSGEPSQRMFDIWRYRIGNQIYGPVEGMPEDGNLPGDLTGPRTTFANANRVWDDKNYLLPIPLRALDVNPNLTQNPGW